VSGKNQYPVIFNWQDADPSIGFLPLNANTQGYGSIPSGVATGVMGSTNTIYSNILDISKMDNQGLEVTWTGDPTGVFSVMVSNSGITFYALTFNPVTAQPAGAAGGMALDMNQLPFKYMMLKYVNASGTGVLSVYGQQKDLN
jgi:hypothetical protein